MSRKIFLSFLGTSIYKETYYIATDQNEETVVPTRFIQEATVRNFCQDYVEGDKIIVFTTKGALSNWEEQRDYDSRSKETVLYEPLKDRLESLNLDCSIENIEIKDGKTPDELWEIFSVVFDSIKQNDQITFDITHGFRTLPMFNMVLINYAKLLKNISVSGIYYGNYEARYTNNGNVFSPIWDLKDYVELQEWTNSAQMFLTAGHADDLVEMIEEKGISQAKCIDAFSKEILSNRCISITDGANAVAVKNLLTNENESSIHPAIKPIFSHIEKQFDKYNRDEVLNALPAIEWCIEHNLIQQGYTIMSEFLPSYVLNFIKEDYKNKDLRNTANGFMAIKGKIEKFRYDGKIKKEQEEVLKKMLKIPFFKKLCERNRSINADHRDDMNHGGFRDKPKDYASLKDDLNDKLEKLKEVINMIENSK